MRRPMVVAQRPTTREFSMALIRAPFPRSFWYHTTLGPSKAAERRDREKEKTARASTGR